MLSTPNIAEQSSSRKIDFLKPFYRIELYSDSKLKSCLSPNGFMHGERALAITDIALIGLEIESCFEPPSHECIITIAHRLGYTLPVKTGDKVRAQLGYYSQIISGRALSVPVFAGEVAHIDASLHSTVLECASSVQKVLQLRKNLNYNRSTVDIILKKLVRDECKLELEPHGVDKTRISKSRFIFSDSVPLFEHVQHLSEQVGFDAYMSIEDRFIAKPWSPQKPPGNIEELYKKIATNPAAQFMHTLAFGSTIIDASFSIRKEQISKLMAIHFAEYGKETENQFTINPLTACQNTAYSGDRKITISLPYVTKNDAETILSNLIARYSDALAARIKTIGSPHVKLGDGVQLSGKFFNNEKPFAHLRLENIIFQVTGLKHHLSVKHGFYTELELLERRIT